MLVACCDQNFGISTSRCSNTSSPRSLAITAWRSSHSISSKGSTPSAEKYRSNFRPTTSIVEAVRGAVWTSELVVST